MFFFFRKKTKYLYCIINNLNYIPFKCYRLTRRMRLKKFKVFFCEHKLLRIVPFRIFKSTNFRKKAKNRERLQSAEQITMMSTHNGK